MFKNETLNVAPAACMTAGTNGSVFTHKRGRSRVRDQQAVLGSLIRYRTKYLIPRRGFNAAAA